MRAGREALAGRGHQREAIVRLRKGRATRSIAAPSPSSAREADLARFSRIEERVAVRVIHACGMVEAARDLVFSPARRTRREAALSAGAPIFCDARMVAEGVTRARLPADNDVVCTLADPRTPELAREAWHDAHGRGDRALGAASRRRGRRDRQRADRAIPPARTDCRRRAATGRDHRHAGRLRRRGRIEGGADRERPAGDRRCAAAKAAARWPRPRSTRWRAKRNDRARPSVRRRPRAGRSGTADRQGGARDRGLAGRRLSSPRRGGAATRARSSIAG